MASRFQDKNALHWDSTCGTVEDEFGEIAGVQSVNYGGGTRTRGRVTTIGSRFPVGDTPGGMTPDEAKMTMFRKDAVAWLKQMRDSYAPSRVGDVIKSFKVKYAALDEENSSLPAEVDSFQAKVNPPKGLSLDRTRESDPLMVEIELFIMGPVKFGDTRIE